MIANVRESESERAEEAPRPMNDEGMKGSPSSTE